MHNETLYPNCSGISKTPVQIIGNFLYQSLVLCIAFPLACLVMAGRGIHKAAAQVTALSFKCCVWVFLAAVVILFVVAITIHLAVASVG